MGRMLFAVWLVAAFALGTYLWAPHVRALPMPPTRALADAVATLRGPADRQTLVVHFMYSRCPCSRRILGSILHEDRPAGVSDKVVLVEHDAELEAEVRRAGWPLLVVTPAELARLYHVESAPMMVVAAPDGSLAYAGGYTDLKGGQVADLDILDRVLRHAPATRKPVLGCAVSDALRRALDPLGLKR